ncbi:MAG: hypothetical protein GTN81_11605 [Proteobacteria bacterium]|nr:hypothetical protein [Pseudomonadota bacterium]
MKEASRPTLTEKEVTEENRRIRRLRFMVDFWLQTIMQADLSRDEALRVVEHVKTYACSIFPGKEDTFELIYRPRFMRVIEEKYSSQSPTSNSKSND